MYLYGGISEWNIRIHNLTLKVIKVFPTRWCLRGFLTPLQKTSFPVELEFRIKISPLIEYEKKVEKSVPFLNGCHFTDFPSALIVQYHEKKNTFPKANFNEIWLKVADR